MRCLVIDDDEHDRELVARMVARAGHQAAAAPTTDAALELARSDKFDVALIDLSMPGTDGFAALRLFRRDHPDVRLLVVSGYDDRPHVISAVAAGADGYVLKTDLGDRLSPALSEVAGGGGPMSARIAHYVLDELRLTDAGARDAEPRTPAPEPEPPPRRGELRLSKRNWEVLKGLSRGLTYQTIAADLNITVNTVRHHVRAIYAKLDARGRNDAVARALGDAAAPAELKPSSKRRKKPEGPGGDDDPPAGDEPGEGSGGDET